MSNTMTGRHEAIAIVAAIVKADYAKSLLTARNQARETLQLHTGREFSPAEVDDFLQNGRLPAGIQVPR